MFAPSAPTMEQFKLWAHLHWIFSSSGWLKPTNNLIWLSRNKLVLVIPNLDYFKSRFFWLRSLPGSYYWTLLTSINLQQHQTSTISIKMLHQNNNFALHWWYALFSHWSTSSVVQFSVSPACQVITISLQVECANFVTVTSSHCGGCLCWTLWFLLTNGSTSDEIELVTSLEQEV